MGLFSLCYQFIQSITNLVFSFFATIGVMIVCIKTETLTVLDMFNIVNLELP